MNVVVLAGGDSSEREVSLASGKAIEAALRRLGHRVENRDPALTCTNGDRGMAPGPVWLLRSSSILKSDLIFIALHGGCGENGKIQCLLEMTGVKYTGSDMAASAIAMDKAMSKRLMVSEGIPTPKWRLFRTGGAPAGPAVIDEIDRNFGYPLIVKPNDGGSTIGLTKVMSKDQLATAICVAAEESGNVLIEQFIKGRELTVAVIDGEALPVVEIRPLSGLYDYEAKYTKGKTQYIAPAEIDPEIARRIQDYSMRAFGMIGASGLIRVDFMLDESGNAFCLEINTLPGMTELSLSPMAAKAVGMDFDQLVGRIAESAMKKGPGRAHG